MLRFAERARHIAVGTTEDAFLNDWIVQGALMHYLTMLGEAARRVSQEFRDQHPAVAWPGIVGLRNRIVHDYNEHDMDIVWQVASAELPALVDQLRRIVPREPDGEEDEVGR